MQTRDECQFLSGMNEVKLFVFLQVHHWKLFLEMFSQHFLELMSASLHSSTLALG